MPVTVTLSGIVTNCGTIALEDVVLFDTLLGTQIAHFDSLPAGAAQSYQTNYLTTEADCGNTLTDIVIAVALDVCGNVIFNDAHCAFQVSCPPRIATALIASSDFRLSGSGGAANSSFTIISATNLATPLSLWLPIFTNTFDANGQFILTNPIDPTDRERYFRLLLQ